MAAVVRVQEKEASSSISAYTYDVFLSFRGDTRKKFTDHLYTALVQAGYHTFRDDNEIEKGESLKPELYKGINGSMISIIVFSKDYASSSWCLDELVMILECKKRTARHVVLPVFYDVCPSEIRKQKGSTGEAFNKYVAQYEAQIDHGRKMELMEKVKRWKETLKEVADLAGMELKNQADGHESKFIQKIIKMIGDKLRRTTLDVAPYEIGLDSQAEFINMWLQDKSNDVSIRAICGMSGIGKSTIAKFVYNQNSSSFDGSSFLANITEVSKQPNGLLCLQRQLLSDISRRKQRKMHNIDEGLAKIRNVVCHKKVLLVLDDVQQVDHIYAILGMQDWLFPGSKIIITTRNERLLKLHQIYKVQPLDQDESVKLFSLHAFGEDCPIESYKKHIERVVQICEGLPLALKVVGSSLSGKSEDEWVNELAKLEAIPHNQILKKLQTSYDSLQDDHDKRLFLHIACFFIGVDKDYTITLLEKCDFHAKIGIQNLIDRCLLTIENGNLLRMHKLIQDMGREIVHQESQEAGERSRLWHHEDAYRVLKNETGTNTVEGLILEMPMLKEASNNAKKRRYEDFCDKSILSNHDTLLKRRFLGIISGQLVSTTSRSPNDVYLTTNAFKSMTKLRLLKLNYVKLRGSYENFPKSLAWLSWRGFPLKYIPVEFPMENLVALDLRYSMLKQVWKKTPLLKSLKILDLSYSEWLVRTPDFVGLPNLEKLILKGCVHLVEICESIGDLEMLNLLDLNDCKTLMKLPRNIGKLGSLKTLDISGCNIGELPSEMKNMKSLEVLNADGIAINPIQNGNGGVKWWQQIVWSMVSTPRRGPNTSLVSLPFSLKKLSLRGCNLSDDSFLENFSNLPSLFELDLGQNPFKRLPICLKDLSKLWVLDISGCYGLQTLDFNCLPKYYFCMDARNCGSLEKITSSSIATLALFGCHKLVDREDDWKGYAAIEFGIFSTYIPGGRSPMLSREKIKGSSIYFTVPSHSPQRIQCLNVYCTFRRTQNDDVAVAAPRARIGEVNRRYLRIAVRIENKTKDLTWIYSLHPQPDEDWEWVSKWRFGNQMEAGDEIIVTFDCWDKYVVKECGFNIVYCDREDENGTTTIEKSHHDFPAFQLSSGAYFLCADKRCLHEDYLPLTAYNDRSLLRYFRMLESL
ncbi:hypothetical protein LguiB_021760 [Lonicera macranthoides]